MSKAFAPVFTAVFVLLATSAPVYAAKKTGNDVQNTFVMIREHNDPIAKKLLTWIYASENDVAVRAPELISFLKENPGWPRQQAIREKIERNMADSIGPAETVAWLKENPPSTFEGIRAYVAALRALGQETEAHRQLQIFWKDKPLNKNETASLAGFYSAWLSKRDHANRLDTLIWQGRYGEAEYMLAFVTPDIRALGQTRIALSRMTSNAEQMLGGVPAELRNNEGLLFERMRWRRRRQMDAGAVEIAQQIPRTSEHGEEWWKELSILARREIEKKNYSAAYKLASRHNMTEGSDYAQAEWLMGWLLMLQNNPDRAYDHFARMYGSVQSAISKSRAAYWSARAAERMKNNIIQEQPATPGAPLPPPRNLSHDWDAVAAQFPTTFYGQLSIEHTGKIPTAARMKTFTFDAAAWDAFNRKDTVRAVRLLQKLKMPQFLDVFLARLIADGNTTQDFANIARLSKELGRLHYAVQANKEAQQKLGSFLFEDGYPTLPSMPVPYPEKALVHAITFRESMFNPVVSSSAGALGLMQLMPGTAKETSAKIGKPYTKEKLTADPNYNVLLGSTYLKRMLDRYNGFYPLAIAAYNAGPGNVDSWIAEMGDPRLPGVNVINWIEHIPIYETRNYVQRVMETYYIYRLRFGETPRTTYEFMTVK